MKQIGLRIKHAREAAGYSQSKLAELVGLTQGAISKIERGEGNPSLQSVIRLSNVLSIPLNDLLSDSTSTSTLSEETEFVTK